MAASSRRKAVAKAIAAPVQQVEKLSLHERLDEIHLVKIMKAFQAQDRQQMSKAQLETILDNIAKIKFEKNEFDLLFLKININRDGLVTWDEFISHLILGFEQKEVSVEFKSLDAPISKKPILLKSNHRHPVNKITFCPTITADGSYDFTDGSYLTSSKDGTINYWTLDMKLDRTVQSTCPELKVQPTWVLDLIALPDVSVVCTSSTERDLRFYDTSARKFELRIMISSLEEAVVCMHYAFDSKTKEECKLIMGDMGGNVKILLFDPEDRGPFKSTPGIPLLHVRYERVIKGFVAGFRVIEFRGLHTDWVRQVSYYKNLSSFMSCSGCSYASAVLKDVTENKSTYVYKVPKGIWCFDFAEAGHIFATGGADCLVRVWNPFVPEKPIAVLLGHHSGILAIVLQEDGNFMYSMSRDRCIKVWDVHAQTCLQTYLDLPNELGEHTDFTILYNHDNRQLIIGCVMIAILFLRPKQNKDRTDGSTHSLGVSVILYNTLFKIILTCGLDSFIIVWDPWTGRRMSVVRNAHTIELHGELLPVEITAATFDPGNQLLLTGATDGTLKMWNFNTGTCLRNMQIEPNCEITGIVWIKGRILAIGWNRHITEFADSGGAAGPGGAFSKPWDTRHTEDVLCVAAQVPQTLATSTYNGELILWRLETGQPYKKYEVANPTERIKIDYKLNKDVVPKRGSTTAAKSSSIFGRKRSSVAKTMNSSVAPPLCSDPLTADPKDRARRISVVQIPETCVPIRGLAVHCMIFLCSRPMVPHAATLMVALENGTIQAWSHHPGGGFLTSFQAIHKAGDYIIAMTTDTKNEFLFTGTTAGYIKIWLMEGYYPPKEGHVCMPKYRIQFPFMWKDVIEGRAKRANRGQPKPILLSSCRAHLLAISGLVYINESKILISCSADCSARMWTLGGRYLGTIGTFKPWIPLQLDTPPGEDHNYTLPTDLTSRASFTTMKVFMGGDVPKSKKQELQQAQRTFGQSDVSKGDIYGKRANAPILGHHFKLPERTTGRHEFTLDTTFAYIPVYNHLIMPPPGEIPQRPSTPEAITASRTQQEVKQSKEESKTTKTK